MNMNTIKLTLLANILLLFVLSAFLVSCQSSNSTPTQPINPTSNSQGVSSANDGATLLQNRCTVCHNLDRVKNEKNSRTKWEQIVNNMIQKGAQLNDNEKTTLIDYLAQNYGQ
ncbi:MAG: hypothetical protein ACPL0B_02165 [Anaerolineales bacterium]